MLALLLHVASLPRAVNLVSLVLGPLQGSHKFVHIDCLVVYILRPISLFFQLHSWSFIPFDIALPVEFLELLAIPFP
jgi:hypothetical protein